ncbi:hypothetical protein [Thalassobellus suaedae]|uniref:Uncharacterized protein n=1 Tax=Thalassobellus suaedae TaxID=3074124 RepID=A0ABY9XRK8_9FLAO|nr:hypothetical protein RHP51_15815 [Flavobacteriaceae bacterium HL-DH14]
MFDIGTPQINQVKLIDFPKSIMNFTLMNIATNLPEQPTNGESKFKETVKENLNFLKSVVYLTKKIFML